MRVSLTIIVIAFLMLFSCETADVECEVVQVITVNIAP